MSDSLPRIHRSARTLVIAGNQLEILNDDTWDVPLILLDGKVELPALLFEELGALDLRTQYRIEVNLFYDP
jgi:hypothetical protein